jgi:hypothetical protein
MYREIKQIIKRIKDSLIIANLDHSLIHLFCNVHSIYNDLLQIRTKLGDKAFFESNEVLFLVYYITVVRLIDAIKNSKLSEEIKLEEIELAILSTIDEIYNKTLFFKENIKNDIKKTAIVDDLLKKFDKNILDNSDLVKFENEDNKGNKVVEERAFNGFKEIMKAAAPGAAASTATPAASTATPADSGAASAASAASSARTPPPPAGGIAKDYDRWLSQSDSGRPVKPIDYEKGKYSTINDHIEWYKKLIDYIIANPDINTYSEEIKNAKQSVYNAYNAYKTDTKLKLQSDKAISDGAEAITFIENINNHMKPINSLGQYDDQLFDTKSKELKESFLKHYNDKLKKSVINTSYLSDRTAAVQAYDNFKKAWKELIGSKDNKLQLNKQGEIVSSFLTKSSGSDSESNIAIRKIYMDDETIKASKTIAKFPRKLGILQGGVRYSRKRSSKSSTKKTRKHRY